MADPCRIRCDRVGGSRPSFRGAGAARSRHFPRRSLGRCIRRRAAWLVKGETGNRQSRRQRGGVRGADDRHGWPGRRGLGRRLEDYHTHSTRKSFMNALYGIYRADGKIDTSLTLAKLDVKEKNTELTPQEKQATILDLLRSRSGVYLPAAGEIQVMRDARPQRGSHPPGTFWYDNNWDFNVLGTIFRQLTGADIFDALKTRIADPIGMEDFDIRQARTMRHPNPSIRATGSESPRAISRDLVTCICAADAGEIVRSYRGRGSRRASRVTRMRSRASPRAGTV